MKKINHIIFTYIVDPVTKIFGIALFAVIMLQIFGRTFMSTPPSWTEEVSRFCFVWFCFLAVSETLRAKQHLGLDYFYNKFSVKTKLVLDVAIHALTMVFGAYCLFYGIQLLSIVGRRTAPITGWNMAWFYVTLPVMGGLMILISLEQILEDMSKLKEKGKEE